MVRKFKLENSEGAVLDLMDLRHFAVSPSGLGIELGNDFIETGSRLLFKQLKQARAELDVRIVFDAVGKRGYAAFDEVARFFDKPPFTLIYSTDDTEEYLRDCRLKVLTKSEIGQLDLLDEQVTLQFTSPWYQWIEGSISEYVDHEGDGKIYDVTYGYIYEDNPMGNQYFFALQNDSRYFGLQQSSAIEITITAGSQPIHNPQWSILQGDRILQNDGYLFTIAPGNQIVVSSDPDRQKALLYVAGEEPFNLYQYQDVTKTNFVTVPLGESVLLFENCKGATITYRMRKEVVLV